ncbi:MAG: YgjV family protein [Oscillospiraceae bacterium]|nr:YgjV family protein [Oscillospiraceae bacterium]
MSNFVIANILSVVCACFTVAASWVPNKEKTYYCQVAQCLVYAVASFFFGVWSSIITMLFCAARNWLAAKERFTMRLALVFSAVNLVIGLVFNNAGVVGLIPIAATLIYNFGCVLGKKLVTIKANVLVNLLLWALYDVCILDIASLVMDVISSATAVAAIIRIRRMEQEAEKTPAA